jgi:adenylate cyclase
MNLPGLTDSIAAVSEIPGKCAVCGANMRVGNGLCLSCTLRQGLDCDREGSRESFEAILGEDEVQDTHWRVGNYEILEEIGRGGMGVIYRARQRHSRRIVALKRVISYHTDSRETLQRFRREAEAAASLDHSNILPIYEVGQGEDGLPFFSMKYAAGGSLQKAGSALRKEPRECVRLMVKVARAVQYAHEQGILHRDLKPGNILLDGHGEPFVSDFGLAKWLDTNTDLTRTLTIFGTPGYIAPEQAKAPAASLTPAADVYSLGAILFDLFTGRPPFLGEHALAVIQQASEKPAPKLRSLAPALDRDVETICERCLEREPAARYRSAGDLAVDLERWMEGRPIVARRVSLPVRAWRWSKRNRKLAVATAVACCSALAAALLSYWYGRSPTGFSETVRSAEKSIAVLPFVNMSEDKANEYFSDGISEELLNLLSKVPQLQVAARTSSFSFKGKPIEIPEIARKLHVANVLEGSVRKSGDQLRITAQLVRASEGYHLWSETYDRKLDDIFKIQDEIAGEVVKQLKVTLLGAKPTVRETDPKAYTLYLQAVQVGRQGTPEAYTQSDALLKQVLEIDPRYAPAWHELTRIFLNKANLGLLPNSEGLARAREAEEKALAIDPNYAPAHAGLGRIAAYNNDFVNAAKHYERAVALDPTDLNVLGNSAVFLHSLGRLQEGLALLEAVVHRDPVNLTTLFNLGNGQIRMGQFDAAIASYRSVLSMSPGSGLTHYQICEAMLLKGDAPAALAEIEQEKSEDWRLIGLPMAYHALGRQTESDAALATVIAKLEKDSSYNIAYVYAFRGEADKAFEWLDKAVQDQNPGLLHVAVENLFDNIHSDPRWLPFLRKIGRAPEQLAKIQFKVTLPPE